MRSFNTELYRISFGQSELDGLFEVSIEQLSNNSNRRTYFGFPFLCEYLVELIYSGKMSRKEASKTIAKAMIHLTQEAS